MSKKPREKGSYTVRGLGGSTGIGIAIGVALYSSGGRWGGFLLVSYFALELEGFWV